jgi:hypothetical protein
MTTLEIIVVLVFGLIENNKKEGRNVPLSGLHLFVPTPPPSFI